LSVPVSHFHRSIVRPKVCDAGVKIMHTHPLTAESPLLVFAKDTLVKGNPAKLDCVEIRGQTYSISKGAVRIVSLEDEWFEDMTEPAAVMETLTDSGLKVDLFTFWQRLPELQPKYPYYQEWESVAALPIHSYDHWFNNQISSRARNQIRKARREGVELRETAYDDEFVRGMTGIFNETPVRQGRPFWHYGKDFETVKRQFSRYVFREEMIGAYYGGEMIGLIMLGITERYAITGQIISRISHRDKATNNLLIAKAVEVCAKKHLPYLVYLFWSDDGLAEFKRRCGFEETKLPRYFVPLSAKGKLALKFGLHRGWKAALPENIKGNLKKLRKLWFELKAERPNKTRELV
jgi:hypothetical protein